MKYKIKYHYLTLKENQFDEYIKNPANAIESIRKEYNPVQEELWLIGVNVKNKIIFKKLLVIGAYNIVLCTPREIFTHVLISGCKSFILAHNHLSEEKSPSEEDIIFTKKIEKGCEYVGLNLLDHIIFTKKDYYSMKVNGII